MPMFYTPKPRQFHYTPRLYNPEKEEWEKLKSKYRLEHALPLDDEEYLKKIENDRQTNNSQQDNADLEYFQRRLKEIQRKEREEKNKLSLSDLFRKREVPQFHYTSRFDEDGNLKESAPISTETLASRRIKRRFEEDDMERFKPIPAGKIIVYTLLVCILLIFIFF